jgi:hypothetical protein
MAVVEDLAPFFSTADFAVDATLGATAVRGIFDAAYSEPLGNVVEGNSPVFMLPTADSDAAGAAHGTTLVIGATTYKVRGIEPDGTGVTLLRLEQQ